ncbi:MAG: DUF2325 domain-containing protein [Pseudomonadota bacterium]|nr:DUF2325 domain-containing protein [Pseudomonadota bacterium]
MCENHQNPGLSDTHSPLRRGRRKLWELPAKYHCPIVGTCLTIGELRRLYRQSGMEPTRHLKTDYDFHLMFVGAAAHRIRPSKLVQKTLDRKYQITIKRLSDAKSAEDLAGFWDEAAARGDVAGAFWALLTHPRAGEAFLDRIYGEVHMLSHLAGAATRVNLARLPALEERNASLEGELRHLKFQTIRQLGERQKRVDELAMDLERSRESGRQFEGMRERIAELESGGQLRSLQRLVTRLQRDLALSTNRVEAAELEAETWRRKAVEASHIAGPVDDPGERPCDEARTKREERTSTEEVPDALRGRCVLYVGGRSKLTPHLRRLVSRRGGRFVHHDGGLSDGWATLNGALEQADAVMCPLDCISHNACSRLKQVCKQRSKPLVLLRGAGVGAFNNGLKVLQDRHLTDSNPAPVGSTLSGVRAVVC